MNDQNNALDWAEYAEDGGEALEIAGTIRRFARSFLGAGK